MPRYCAPVREVIKGTRETKNDEDLNPDMVAHLFGKSKAKKVRDLSDHQLVQVMLMDAHRVVVSQQQRLVELSQPRPNRAARRGAKVAKRGRVTQ